MAGYWRDLVAARFSIYLICIFNPHLKDRTLLAKEQKLPEELLIEV